MFSKEDVLNYLNKVEKSTFIDMVKYLKIKPKDNKMFSSFLLDLKKEGIISYSKRHDCYFVPKLIGNFDCEFIVNSKGMQFCSFNYEQEVKRALIFSNNLNVLKGDLVNVDIYKDIDDGFYFGILKSIIKRKNLFLYAQVDDDLSIKPIYFSQPYNFKYEKSALKPNTFVRFNIDKIEKDFLHLSLNKTISNIDEPYSDINFLIDFSNVKKEFSNETIAQTKSIPDEVQDEKKFDRVDLTNKMIVTIDGEKTKDFDDAISVEILENNNFLLGVHIADVAYYVEENSDIDLEARSRGTSIYLIDKVIPMLPEKLSNGICSLNPNVKRFTLTLEAQINNEGSIINHRIYPSLIESKYRLTYNQVANMDNETFIKEDKQLYEMLKNAYRLSNILANVKEKQGYIDFEIEEPIIELDKQTGKAINIKNRHRLSSEILIENFMVFANEVVSKTISDLKIPSIYRVHEAPEPEKIESLKLFIKSLGINNVKVSQSKDPKVFQNMVNQLKKERFDNLIKMSLLRTMQKAKYSSNNIGHFGLASEYYSHFTSPIRRYPDLLLHRIIWEVLIKKNKNYSIDNLALIDKIAKNSSEAEIKATDLERKVNDVKKAEYYESKINTFKEATIVSIHKFGIFVEFDDLTNSLIHISTITNSNNYEITSDLCNLILKNPSKTYSIGQKVNVKIISINKMEGKIDSILID